MFMTIFIFFSGLRSWRKTGCWSSSAKGMAGLIFLENWNSMRKCWKMRKMLRVRAFLISTITFQFQWRKVCLFWWNIAFSGAVKPGPLFSSTPGKKTPPFKAVLLFLFSSSEMYLQSQLLKIRNDGSSFKNQLQEVKPTPKSKFSN